MGWLAAGLAGGSLSARAGSAPAVTFYVPFPEADYLTALQAIENGGPSTAPADPVTTYISIATIADGTVIYYDHWEDGYENSLRLGDPLQATTEIWGDNDPSNGMPPGFTNDYIHAGNAILLYNQLTSSVPLAIDYDGRDKIEASRAVSITRTFWTTGPDTLLAGSFEVFDTTRWGLDFRSPVGQNIPDGSGANVGDHQMFEYTGLSIIAAKEGTTVRVDADNNGVFETTNILGQGETLLVNGGVNVGGRVLADKPVSVILINGDIASNYESRDSTLLPLSLWSRNYYTPVSTPAGNGTRVWLYNPSGSAITINYDTRAGTNAIVTAATNIAAGSYGSVLLPTNTAARFYSGGGETGPVFYAYSTTDSDVTTTSDNQAWDWSFTLIPDTQLVPQLLVGLGIGRDPTSPVNPSENGNPIWVTTVGNGESNVTVYVDYDGDGIGPLTDPNGFNYDTSYSVRELQQLKIYDPDGDQSSMLIYVLATNVNLAGAWGQDPLTSTAGAPGLDVGTSIPPMDVLDASKDLALVDDTDGDGYLGPSERAEYLITVGNTTRAIIPAAIFVVDELPPDTSYVPGTTFYRVGSNGVWVAVADDGSGTPFPLDGTGLVVNAEISIRNYCYVKFLVDVKPPAELSATPAIVNTGAVWSTKFDREIFFENETFLHGSLGDYVWLDADGDGVQDAEEPGLVGVVVYADINTNGVRDADEPISTTSSNGYYLLEGGYMIAGTYSVRVDPGTLPAGLLPSYDLDGTGTSHQTTAALAPGEDRTDVDFGYIPSATLGDFTWVDSNGNGQQDGGEPALAGVVVRLYNAASNVIGTTTSSAAGAYGFANLWPAAYYVDFTPPAGYFFTTSNVGSDATDSDPLPGTNCTAFVTLTNGQADLTVDAGFVQAAALGDYTWEDNNFNGQQDSGEPALAGVVITLYDVASNVVGVTTSSAAGLYAFTNLPPGAYSVGFTPPGGYQFTVAETGADATDSDANPFTGLTGSYTLAGGQADNTVDAGFYNPAHFTLKLFKSTALTNNWDFGVTNDYYLTLQNTGTVALAGVALTDALPPGVSFVAGSAQIVRMTAVTTNSFVETVADGFTAVSYANNDGTVHWAGNWTEVGDNGSAASGSVLVRVTGGTNALVFEGSSADNDHVTRTNALAAAAGRTYTNVTLSFAYRRRNWDSGDSFSFYLSTNGFAGQSNLVFAVPTSSGSDGSYVQISTNLTDHMGAQMALRLRAGGSFSYGDQINFDHVTFANSGFEIATNIVPVYAPGVAVAVLSNLPAATPANLLANYTVPAGSSVTVRIQATLDMPLVATQFINTATATNPVTPPLVASVTNYSVANTVGDRAWLDANANGIQDGGEPGLTGVTVRIYSAAANLLAATTTDASGAYSFTNLPSGSYYLEFSAAGYVITAPDQGGDDALDSDIDGAGRTAAFSLSGGTYDPSRDAGFYRLASLGDYTWEDLNRNGQQDGGEPALSNVVVTLYDAASNVVGVTTSSAAGAYAFTDLMPGSYFVGFALPAGYQFAPADTGSDATDSDARPATGRTGFYALASGQNDLTADAGFYRPARLGDYTWEDSNGNGQQDGGEPALAGVVVTLYDAASNVVGVTTSAVSGAYEFPNLAPGAYFVGFAPPAGYRSTVADTGADATDSDASPATGLTGIYTLAYGQTDLTVDAGFLRAAALGDYTWQDSNCNGQQDGDEPALADVVVTLYDAVSNVVGVTTSSVSGAYLFTDLNPGGYFVAFTLPSGYQFTVADAGADATDSDPNPATGRTPVYVLVAGETNRTVDAGFYNLGDISLRLYKSRSLTNNWDYGLTNDYYLTLENTGTVALAGIALTDTLPAGVAFVPGSAQIVQLTEATLTPFAETVADGFGTVAYANNDGTAAWLGNWSEVGDNNSPASGTVLVQTSPYTALLFQNYGVRNDHVTRTNPLAAGPARVYTNITLSFSYLRQNWDATDSLTVYLSTNGFATQSNLVYTVPGQAITDSAFSNFTFDVTAWQGAQLALRLRAGPNFGYNDRIYFDHVTFTNSGHDVATRPVPVYGPGVAAHVVADLPNATPASLLANYTLPAGSSVTVRIQATLDVPLAATQFINTAVATNPATPPLSATVTNVSVLNSVGDRVWFDVDGDGLQDGGETGLTGVTVRIYAADSTLVAETTTGADGAYVFTDLPSGTYYLEFVSPPDYLVTAQDQGGDDAQDSDIDGAGRTAAFTLAGGTHDATRDAGFYQPPAALGDFVWLDANVNGLQDGGSETGMPGVVVRLYGAATNLVAETTTGAGGAYLFTNLPPADYLLEFVLPAGYTFTLRDQGADDALDSNPALATGRTERFHLPPGTNDLGWDAGLVPVLPGLMLTKTADAGDCLAPGDAIVYTLEVRNTGTVTMTGVAVEDVLPPGLTYVAGSAEMVLSNTFYRTFRDEFSTVSYARQDGTDLWAADWQESDPYGTAGPAGNYAGVTNGQLSLHYAYVGAEAVWRWADLSGETNAVLAFDWQTISLDASEYLAVEVASAPDGPFTTLGTFGRTATGSTNYDISAYISTSTTIRVEAAPGSQNWESGEYGRLDNVQISCTKTVVATNPAGAPPRLADNQILAPAGRLVITFAATVDRPGVGTQLVNVATANAPGQPTLEAATTNCVRYADVGVRKRVSDATPDMGATILYTLTASNNGPDTATGVVLTDVLPAQVTYQSHSNGAYDAGTGAWTVGTLDINATTTLYIRATVGIGTAGQSIPNTVTVTGRDLYDPVPENDTDSVVIVPKSWAVLGDRIWFDQNRNGIQDAAETNVFPGIPVALLDTNGAIVAETVTDSQGLYRFETVLPQTYLIRFDLAAVDTNGILSPANVGDNDEVDSDVISGSVGAYALTGPFTTKAGQTNLTIDLGIGMRNPTRAELIEVCGEWAGGAGRVAWRTASEFGTAGFFVYRVDPETGIETRLNDKLLPSAFREDGAAYALADPEARAGARGVYRLEEQELSGVRRDLGTHAIVFSAPPPAPAAPRAAAKAAAPRAAARSASPSPVLKVQVRQEGIYGVALSAVAAGMGRPLAEVRALAAGGQLQLTRRGAPVPLIHDAERDRLVFHGTAPAPGWYVHESVYLLAEGAGRAMPRREPVAGSGAEIFPVQLHFEKNLFLFSMTQMPADFYFWAGVISGFGELSVQSFPLDLAGHAGGDVRLKVHLMGWSSSTNNPDHLAKFGFNGTEVGSLAFDDQEPAEAELTIPAAAVVDGLNTLTVEGILPPGRSASFFVVDWIEAAFNRRLVPGEETAHFRAGGAAAVSAAAFAEPLALALDEAGAPTWVADATGALPAKAWATDRPDERFAVAETETVPLLMPEPAAADAWFMAPHNAVDYLVIASRELAPAAQALVDYRAGQGLRARLAVFEDICDLVAGGERTPEAIPLLLRQAAATWEKAPALVVLAGNGHYDYLGANTTEANHLPPLLVQTAAGVCAADGRLADTGGDARPDLAIGRLPARTGAELAVMIAKIQAYEAGFGTDWQNELRLAADKTDAAVASFSAANDRWAALAAAPYAVPSRIDLDQMPLAAAQAEFLSWFQQGSGFIHYTGHGGMKNLGAQNLLSWTNVAAMTNAARLPVLVTLTCLAARYEAPGADSLGELMLRRADGGAVAMLGPSGLAQSGPATELGEAFYRTILQDGEGRLGLAFLRARRALAGSHFADDTFAVYNLLGDPALRVAGNPAADLPDTSAQVELTGLEQIYDGQPRSVTVATVPAGLPVRITYDGNIEPPTAAGHYAVSVTTTAAEYEGFATGLLVVARAPAQVVLSGLDAVYDGEPQPVEVETAPAGLAVELTYDGAAAPPVVPGAYTVAARVTDPNYAGEAAGTLAVAKMAAQVQLAGLVHAFDGNPAVVQATTRPAGLELVITYDGESAPPAAAGQYAVVATVADELYAGSATGTLVVARAQAEIELGNLNQTYDGQPRPVTAQTYPDDLAVAVTYDGAPAVPRNAGTYAVVGTVQDANWQGVATDTLTISKGHQTIDFPPIGDQLAMDVVDLSARAASGLPVAFAVASGPAAIDANGRLAFTGAGAVTVVASQAGDANWEAAPAVAHTFHVGTLLVSTKNVQVRENSQGRFFLRLAAAPAASVTYTVNWMSGDSNLTVQGGAARTFTAANWSNWQAVVIGAADDGNAVGETATLQISSPGLPDRFVTATALDDDLGENLALAAGGTTITGTKASRPELLIDGVHNTSTNYGHTGLTYEPPGTMTMDLQRPTDVARLRLHTWDWLYRFHRYRIEGSADGEAWTLLVDASEGEHSGWEEWDVTASAIRYLRFTGLFCSALPSVMVTEWEVYGEPTRRRQPEIAASPVNVREAGEGRFYIRLHSAPTGAVSFAVRRMSGDAGLTVQSGAKRTFTPANWSTWQTVTLAAAADDNDTDETAVFCISAPGWADQLVTATALDDDLGANLALAAGGATITGVKASRPGLLIDGVHNSSTNYGHTGWTNNPPGSMTLDLRQPAAIARVRLLNWNWLHRAHRYRIEASRDGEAWTLLADASGEDRHGWDDWPAGGQTIRYLRFTGLSNSVNQSVVIAELEVYGEPVVARGGLTVGAADTRTSSRTAAAAASFPVTVVTGDDGPDHTNGWPAVDGDLETAWVGRPGANGWYIALEYDTPMVLTNLLVEVAEDSAAQYECLYSQDALEWGHLTDALEAGPVELRFLWLVFPGGAAPAAPRVLEITPQVKP